MKMVSLLWLPVIALLVACAGDPCANQECENGGICIDGRCDCPEGFVGVNCELALDPCLTKDCHPSQATGCVANDQKARCVCADGFEGEECRAQWTDKYLGFYQVEETCNGKIRDFRAEIKAGPRFKQLTLSNFHDQSDGSGSSARLVANLIQSNVFDLYQQFMPFGVVEGAGSYQPSNGELRLNYQIIESDGDTLACSATFRPE